MSKVSDGASREDVFKFISRSASYGNLGLFVGAGFTKAVLNDKSNVALSWGELLASAAKEMGIDYVGVLREGASYPEIARRICKEHGAANGMAYSESLSRLKRTIADLTCWYPNQQRRKKFSPYLDALSPAWIITTNYDLVIEALVTGKSIPLGPNDTLSSRKGIIPVYHLHGARTNPDDIIIAQEDYVALFRPTEYRQIKLALTMMESTTLLIGYGLGDVNVLTALDWSTNVFSGEDPDFPSDVVQVVRVKVPDPKPYRDSSGILIIETTDLTDFFEQFSAVRDIELALEAKENEGVKTLAESLMAPSNNLPIQFVDDQQFRTELIKILSSFPVELISGFISILDKAIDETWKRSEPYGAFSGYGQTLTIILDILEGLDVKKIPPALFQSVAYGLARVAPLVGTTLGQSFHAAEIWKARKGNLKPQTLQELRNISAQHAYDWLDMLLDTIEHP